MAYNSCNLSALTYANGFTLWHYKTPDDMYDVVAHVGYFNKAAGMLRVGDFIFGNFNLDDEPRHGHLAVLSNSNGVVEVALAATFSVVRPVTAKQEAA